MSAAAPSSNEAPVDVGERLRLESERIQALLEDIGGAASAATWQRVEELVARLTGLYGAGLERLLMHVDGAVGLPPALRQRLCDDEVVSSLLLLHGLHPAPLVERVQRALDEVRPYLGSHAGGVELLGVDDDGTVSLRLLGSCDGCPSSRQTVESTIREAIEAAAPEVVRIDVDAPSSAPRTSEPLVHIDLSRAKARTRTRWMALDVGTLPLHGRVALEVGGTSALVVRLQDGLVAYRNRCPGCEASVDDAPLEGTVLACRGCGARFDVGRGGRGPEADSRYLEALPVLEKGGGARIAVQEER